jgi:3-oxoacyl-[acyl-carrier protein] reductase
MTNNTKVALVTGGSRGIGAAIARRLASEGCAVALNYASDALAAEALVAELKALGAKAMAVCADVSQAAQVSAMFASIEQTLGRIDILVNNAGVLQLAPLAQASDELFARSFAINTQGVFNTLRLAATRLNDGGRIINLSSSVLALRLPGYGIYSASKAAVEALTEVFAKELRGRGITVNAVAPGPVASQLFLKGKSAEEVQAFARMAPLERLGQPEDIAGVVAFLAGPDGGWVNGQVLRANGGLA